MSVPAISTSVGSFYLSRSQCRSSSRGLPRRSLMAIRSGAVSVAPILTNLRKDTATPLPVLRHVADAMATDMRNGLAIDGGSDLKMILSYVDTLPTGNEKGLFYALDLGGTNFRVLRVQLGGKEERVIDTEFEQVSIPQDLMFGTSEQLFDFMASGLAKFSQKEGGKFHLPSGRTREIGFTFSFPVRQLSIDSGILMKWTKGFAVSGTPGKDIVACLNEAMGRLGLEMRVSALVNDAVGTLAGARYWDDDVMVAVILGTGTNACYVERTDAIPKQKGQVSSSGRTIINTEWGAFSSGLPLTVYDNEMDAASINPGEQIFEKTISGMYLGEIVRRVLLKMAQAGDLFGKSVPEKLFSPFILRTPDLCAMQQDNSDDLQSVGSILYNVAGLETNLSARKIVVEVCDTIVKRGGRLAGAGIVGILQKMEEDSKGLIFGKRTVVAMDGGLYENYPQYRKYLQEAVTELLGTEISRNVVIEHSKDGSGIGAALLAAANSKTEDGLFCYSNSNQSSLSFLDRFVCSAMIRFILLQNRQGKTRLAKYYVPLEDSEKHKVEYEVHRLVVNRDPKFTNFVEFRTHKVIYRRYAGLFFSLCVDITDNELAYLECIHLFVEILDHFFSNVCELDLVFNFHKVYLILDEFILAGELQETSKKAIIERMGELEKLE
uniref:AP-2 complex subunit sigma n=31 Tax=rosids TaxID=71275 RepID=A0A803NNB7_CANSA